MNRKLAAEALGCRGYILQSFRIVLAGFASPLNDDLVLDKSIYTGIRWYSNQQSGKIDRRQRQRGSGREETSEGGLLYSIVIGDSRGVNISKERMDMLKEGTLGSLFNVEMLPYMKYLVGEREWSRFINGSSTKQEKRKVLDALEKNLLRNSNQIRLLAEIRQHQEKYGTSLRACISRKEPMSIAEKLEGLRPKICAVYNIEESEFEKCKHEALEMIEQNATDSIA